MSDLILYEKRNKVLIIGHRGGTYNEAPENTLKAFKRAIKLGADYIELDVHQTKDREFVVIHDSNTFKTTGYNGIVEEMNLHELIKLDCGEGEKIPTLQEVINLVKNKINLMCEIKSESISLELIKLFKKENMLKSTIFTSFLIDELKKIQEFNHNLKIGAIVPFTEEYIPEWYQKKDLIEKVIDWGFAFIITRFKNVNLQFINFCHKNKLKVVVYSIKSKINMKKYIEMGVDGIIVKNISKVNELFS